jgi:hypothetical protein
MAEGLGLKKYKILSKSDDERTKQVQAEVDKKTSESGS